MAAFFLLLRHSHMLHTTWFSLTLSQRLNGRFFFLLFSSFNFNSLHSPFAIGVTDALAIKRRKEMETQKKETKIILCPPVVAAEREHPVFNTI